MPERFISSFKCDPATKRLRVDTEYYQTYNCDNITLVNIRNAGAPGKALFLRTLHSSGQNQRNLHRVIVSRARPSDKEVTLDWARAVPSASESGHSVGTPA